MKSKGIKKTKMTAAEEAVAKLRDFDELELFVEMLNTIVTGKRQIETDEIVSQLKTLTKEFEANAVRTLRIASAAVDLLLAAGDVLDSDLFGSLEDAKNYLSKYLSEALNGKTSTENIEAVSADIKAV